METINLGTPGMGDGDIFREGGRKINANFTEAHNRLQAVEGKAILADEPIAPTPPAEDNSQRVASTTWVLMAIAHKIAELVDSSPATLDTLNELAAALGDDPNFATTITALIGTKQPQAAELDALALIAGQAFGRNLLTLTSAAGLRAAAGYGAAVEETLTAYDVASADAQVYRHLTAAGTKTINVRAEATHALPANGEWHFDNRGAGVATFAPAGGVTILPPKGGTLEIEQGDVVTLKRLAPDVFRLLGSTKGA